MQSKFFAILAILALSLSASAKEDHQPIVIQLESGLPLLKIYLAPIYDEENSFPQSYVHSLQAVLQFDLNHNGATEVMPPQSNHHLDWNAQFDLTQWEEPSPHFVVQTRIKSKQLDVRLWLAHNNSIKTIQGMPLTGNLSQDRRIIHALADSLYKTLFDAEGIASTHILFTIKKLHASSKKWVSEVYEADYDGGNVRQITSLESTCVTPAYIPPRPDYRSRSFVFVSYQIGQPKIYFGSLENKATQRFSLLKGNQLMPSISLQRDKIAFICDVTGNPDLFLQTFDGEKGPVGKPRQIYSTHKAAQGTPSFSPDGKKIAFVSNKDGHPRIYVIEIPPLGMPLKEIKAQMITKLNRENSAPAWSSDGKKIAFCALSKGTRQIWVYDFESDIEKQITHGKGNKENPTWAPNSQHLMYNTSDPNASELYLIDVLHPNPTLISVGTGEKHFPSWEPIIKH